MTQDEIVAAARIVTPEQAATSHEELLLMHIALGVARISGAPAHVVKFPDGVAAMVFDDPSDKETWRKALIKIHEAALAGYTGPIDTRDQSK